MKTIKPLLLLFTLVALMSSCGPSIYLANDFSKTSRSHKTIGILPLEVTMQTKKLPKDMTREQLEESNMETGYSMQNNVYSAFLKDVSKGKYNIKFQDVSRTNALLEKANVSYHDINTMDKSELAKLLSVDAVLSGNVRLTKPMSGAGAAAMGILFGAWGSTNKTFVTMNIHDGSTSDLLWKYDHEASGTVGSDPETLTKNLMKNVAKKFPYKK